LHRLAVVADSGEQLRERLGAFRRGEQAACVLQGRASATARPKVAFLFSGQGAQYPRMGRELYETQALFRQWMERCGEIVAGYLPRPLTKVLYGNGEDAGLLEQTLYTQTALFAIEYSLAQLWESWGILPAVVLGHSV